MERADPIQACFCDYIVFGYNQFGGQVAGEGGAVVQYQCHTVWAVSRRWYDLAMQTERLQECPALGELNPHIVPRGDMHEFRKSAGNRLRGGLDCVSLVRHQDELRAHALELFH